ncbi:MAG: alginate lyase family protein [Acidobacteria bacterium]|nr:alginate lyase family protein [Acidobacteriota bacterium]
MNRLYCLTLSALFVANAALAQSPSMTQPRVFLLDARWLAEAKQRVQKHDKTLETALARLEQNAKKALTAGPFTVTGKTAPPPSGDKRDYSSQAPYWWPDPSKPNGLPYIRRDGERNPELERYQDHRLMDEMAGAVKTLTLAYYFTGNEQYADKAASLLRTWFLNPETRMNPNLRYAQFIPGINDGRGIGLIETRGLAELVDAIGLLAGSKSWKEADQKQLQSWFDQFLTWMLESKNGRDESASENNHGTYYDLQTASFALFVGKPELAKQILQTSQQKRIARQIEPDGQQPLELERTRSWSYSVMNLEGLISLAVLGDRVGLDLWGYKTPKGGSIRKAIEYLKPFALEGQKWTHKQIIPLSLEEFHSLARRAAAGYRDEQFRAMTAKLPKLDPADVRNLLYPPIPN